MHICIPYMNTLSSTCYMPYAYIRFFIKVSSSDKDGSQTAESTDGHSAPGPLVDPQTTLHHSALTASPSARPAWLTAKVEFGFAFLLTLHSSVMKVPCSGCRHITVPGEQRPSPILALGGCYWRVLAEAWGSEQAGHSDASPRTGSQVRMEGWES